MALTVTTGITTRIVEIGRGHIFLQLKHWGLFAEFVPGKYPFKPEVWRESQLDWGFWGLGFRGDFSLKPDRRGTVREDWEM